MELQKKAAIRSDVVYGIFSYYIMNKRDMALFQCERKERICQQEKQSQVALKRRGNKEIELKKETQTIELKQS